MCLLSVSRICTSYLRQENKPTARPRYIAMVMLAVVNLVIPAFLLTRNGLRSHIPASPGARKLHSVWWCMRLDDTLVGGDKRQYSFAGNDVGNHAAVGTSLNNVSIET